MHRNNRLSTTTTAVAYLALATACACEPDRPTDPRGGVYVENCDPPTPGASTDGECDSGTSPVSGLRYFAIGGVCLEEGIYGEALQAVDVSSLIPGSRRG